MGNRFPQTKWFDDWVSALASADNLVRDMGGSTLIELGFDENVCRHPLWRQMLNCSMVRSPNLWMCSSDRCPLRTVSVCTSSCLVH